MPRWHIASVCDYDDDAYHYMHVRLEPRHVVCQVLPTGLLKERQWRAFVSLPPGWEHYAVHRPEPHILMFRRKKKTPPSRKRKRTLSQSQAAV